MSFVSKGEKTVHNKAKGASKGADRSAVKDGFGKKGERAMHNVAGGSKDKPTDPVSTDANNGYDCTSGPTASGSQYDPASGKRAKSVADLRSAAKKLNERSAAGSASPVGSEGGQDGKHSSAQNSTGYMKSGDGAFGKKSKKPPRAAANLDGTNDMEDPMDEGEENSGQTEEGMTPSGKSRKKAKSLKDVRNAYKKMVD